MEHRRKLIEKIKSQGLPSVDKALPLVSLEDFFIGNDDMGSIGCNLFEHPGLEFFFERLLEIRARDDVQDVLVEINEVVEDHEEMWPFSDRVYILTSAAKEEVVAWVAPLTPDEIEDGFAFGRRSEYAPELQEGVKVYGVWWD